MQRFAGSTNAKQRDEQRSNDVPAGEGDAGESPRRLITAHHVRLLQRIEQQEGAETCPSVPLVDGQPAEQSRREYGVARQALR